MAKIATTALKTDNTNQAGYTLMELLVVMVIIALATAVIAPRLIISSPTKNVKNAAIQLTALYKKGRVLALRTGVSQVVIIDTVNKAAWLNDQGKVMFDDSVDIDTITARTESGTDLAGIRFFPDGTSTGGEITVSSDTISYVISVIWANAEVRLETEK
ncbi:MAG: prepilin-type N-terminal cleavage/methylation domain-containing protein [Robiginitomaculum sp.]|nr:prepilin-type N-terminal cleavage/methylation domain-containing protein [Robiginitomaculum sp.]